MISREALRERLSQVDVGKWLRFCRGLAIIVATLLMLYVAQNFPDLSLHVIALGGLSTLFFWSETIGYGGIRLGSVF